jgi:hypothetical protein
MLAVSSLVPKDRKPRQPGADHQRNIRIPGLLMDRIKAAMDYEGVSNFSQFTHAALTAKCREIEKKQMAAEPQK